MLPRNTKKSRKAKAPEQPSAQKGISLNSLKDLAQKIKQKFKWKHTPRDFQMDAVRAQLQRKDVLIHAGTGAGKTFIAAGPHAHEACEGKVTFMISPLTALQEEQVGHCNALTTLADLFIQVQGFREEYGLTATAINSLHGGCTKEIMAVC